MRRRQRDVKLDCSQHAGSWFDSCCFLAQTGFHTAYTFCLYRMEYAVTFYTLAEFRSHKERTINWILFYWGRLPIRFLLSLLSIWSWQVSTIAAFSEYRFGIFTVHHFFYLIYCTIWRTRFSALKDWNKKKLINKKNFLKPNNIRNSQKFEVPVEVNLLC